MSNGKINIYPEIVDGNSVNVAIVGDSKGLKYLAKIINQIADFDSQKGAPKDERHHVHLHRNEQLGWHSCEVEICRAEANETGELPDFMND